jgi:hypothetical protein
MPAGPNGKVRARRPAVWLLTEGDWAFGHRRLNSGFEKLARTQTQGWSKALTCGDSNVRALAQH